MKYVYSRVWRKRKKKRERDWDSTMVYDQLPVCVSECVCVSVSERVCVCVYLNEKFLQWCIYDTPFTSGGASCLSFFIPRSLMGLGWWRDVPSPPTPPWEEEGPPPPPPPPRPPDECCTLRSLLLSTRICGEKETSTVWSHSAQVQRDDHWWTGCLVNLWLLLLWMSNFTLIFYSYAVNRDCSKCNC